MIEFLITHMQSTSMNVKGHPQMFVLRHVPKSVQDSVSYCSGTLSYRLKAHEVRL